MKLHLAGPEERAARDRLTFTEWGQKLTEEQFLRRELHMREHYWVRERMESWHLLSDTGADVLSSCESFRMDAFFAAHHTGRLAAVYGIASVYTAAAHRRKGYAGELIQRIIARKRAEDPDCLAFILYTEAGESVYNRVGFVARPSYNRVYVVATQEFENDPAGENSIHHLTRAELADYWPSVPRVSHEFVIWPSGGQLDMHFERESVYARSLGREPLQYHALRLGENSIIVWTADFKNDRLSVLFFRAGSVEVANVFVNAALALARRHYLRKVVFWETDDFANWAELSAPGEREVRESAISMICPVHPGVRPEHWIFASRSIGI